jgi:hypothetical protein
VGLANDLKEFGDFARARWMFAAVLIMECNVEARATGSGRYTGNGDAGKVDRWQHVMDVLVGVLVGVERRGNLSGPCM